MDFNHNALNRLEELSFNTDIMIEPRLTEYIKRKVYNKDNNIVPCVEPEQEFMITEQDLRNITKYLNGETDIYNNNYVNKNERPLINQQYFPSSYFKPDKRVPKLQDNFPKVAPNMGMFALDNLDNYNNQYINQEHSILDGRDLDNSRFDPRADPRMNRGQLDFNPSSSKYKINYSTNDNRTYNNGPKQLNASEEMLQEETVTDVLESGLESDSLHANRYGHYDNSQFSELSDMDYDTKMVMPKVAVHGNKNINSSMYVPMPHLNNANSNTELETNMIRGMPTRTLKSYGFRNPAEHYYGYIDPVYQNANNTVLPFPRGGDATRLENTKTNKKYSREIL